MCSKIEQTPDNAARPARTDGDRRGKPALTLAMFGLAFINLGGGASIQQFQQCLANAGNAPNPAAVQAAADQCAQQFGQQLPGGATQPGEPEGG